MRLFDRFAIAGVILAAAACNETVEPLDLAGPPAAVVASSGDAQLGSVSTQLPAPIAVRVTDAAGAPVPGVVVEWTASAGSLSQARDTTGNDGIASVMVTLPATAGTVVIDAEVEGLAPVTFVATASPSAGLLTFRYIDAGSYHACGITTQEESVCWGFNEDGQIGSGVFATIAPMTRVSTDRTVRMSSAGRYHSCEVTLSGDIWCGGSNTAAQLGLPASPPITPFVRLPAPRTAFRIVQSGLLHSCGLSLSKQVWCWGSDGEGQVGDGPTSPIPGEVTPPVFVLDNANAVTTTGLHTCVLLADGEAQCWGLNESGQLGNGSTTNSGDPVSVGVFSFRTEPDVVPHAPDPDFYIPGQSFISAGFAHTCGVTTANSIACWGENESGQLGRGTFVDASLPGVVVGGISWRAVSAGFKHTCALALDGLAFCWGNNDFGQLGDGTTTTSNTPVQVAGGLTFQSISAGETFSCGVTTAGAAYCWGDNVYGQLGMAGTSGALVPTKLPFQP